MVSATAKTTATNNPKKIIGNKDIDIEKGDEEIKINCNELELFRQEEINQEQNHDLNSRDFGCENHAKVFLWSTCGNPYDSHQIIVFLSDSDPDPSNSIIPILILLVMMLSIIVVYELVVVSAIMHEMKVLIDTVRGSGSD
jgi:hypothetical protein